jgi:hypothetical protein
VLCDVEGEWALKAFYIELRGNSSPLRDTRIMELTVDDNGNIICTIATTGPDLDIN